MAKSIADKAKELWGQVQTGVSNVNPAVLAGGAGAVVGGTLGGVAGGPKNRGKRIIGGAVAGASGGAGLMLLKSIMAERQKKILAKADSDAKTYSEQEAGWPETENAAIAQNRELATNLAGVSRQVKDADQLSLLPDTIDISGRNSSLLNGIP